MFDFVGKAKYNAWKKIAGMSKEDAMVKYVELLTEVCLQSSLHGFKRTNLTLFQMLKKSDDEASKQYLAELEGKMILAFPPQATANV